LLAALPAGTDPCGEYQEFHTYVHDGPIFRRPVPVGVGDVVIRDGRHYVDLLAEPNAVCVPSKVPAMPPL
jgi:diphthamide synthase (EF-2-diphthine--ammonia ligase)